MRAHPPGTAMCFESSQSGALLAGGAAPFQSMTVSHLPCDGGPRSILSQSRSRYQTRLHRHNVKRSSRFNAIWVLAAIPHCFHKSVIDIKK